MLSKKDAQLLILKNKFTINEIFPISLLAIVSIFFFVCTIPVVSMVAYVPALIGLDKTSLWIQIKMLKFSEINIKSYSALHS